MAAYLVLENKHTGAVFEGQGLVDLDNEIRVALGIAPDPVDWYLGWYNAFGVALALGWPWDRILAECITPGPSEGRTMVEHMASTYNNLSVIGR